MKYITKNIYNTMQKSYPPLIFQVSSKVNNYSDELYNKLYSLKEKEYLKFCKKIKKVDMLKTLSLDENPKNIDGTPMTKEEIDNAEKSLKVFREEMMNNYVPYIYDIKKEISNFKKGQKQKIKYLTRLLPKNILNEVADIRVLALGYITSKNKKAIEEYCNSNLQKVNQAFKKYEEYYKKTFSNEEDKIFEDNLHDSYVFDYIENNNNLELNLNSIYSDISKIIFEDYKVIKQDGNIENAYWLYNEIYKTDNGYELHILLDVNGKLISVIISFSKVRFIRNEYI